MLMVVVVIGIPLGLPLRCSFPPLESPVVVAAPLKIGDVGHGHPTPGCDPHPAIAALRDLHLCLAAGDDLQESQ
jgi:hypothetical protein